MAINHYDPKLQRTSTHLKSSSEDDRSLSLDAAREDVLRKSVQKVANRSSEMSTSMKEKRERKLEEIVSKFHGDTDTLKRTQQPAYESSKPAYDDSSDEESSGSESKEEFVMEDTAMDDTVLNNEGLDHIYALWYFLVNYV